MKSSRQAVVTPSFLYPLKMLLKVRLAATVEPPFCMTINAASNAISTAASRFLGMRVDSDAYPYRTVTGHLAIRDASVPSIRTHAQKFGIDQRIEHRLTQLPIHAAQTSHLFWIELHPRHLQKLGAETIE